MSETVEALNRFVDYAKTLEAKRAARGTRPALFEMHDDHRPAAERTAATRHAEPSLLICLPRDA